MINEERLKDLVNFIPGDVKNILLDITINNENLTVYLGGGYLRDLYAGLCPKDLDIFLAPMEDCPWNGVEYIPQKVMVNYRKTVEDLTVKSDMEARGLQRLTGLWWPHGHSVKDIQYITYKNPMTLEAVAKDFDIGICQIAYNPLSDVLYYSENFVEGFDKEVIECFHEYDVERTVARFDRMIAKYPHFKVIGMPERPVKVFKGLGISSGKSQSNSV